MTIKNGPTLTDSKGMGGIIAQDGFAYQVWEAVSRLPAWLKTPGFECLGIEMLEDFEARFFAPHTRQKHILDRYQAKSGILTKADLIEVFESFRAFKTAHPDSARVQTLITPGLPAKLNWLTRWPNRVRDARPFYSPFSAVLAANDADLLQRLVKELGKDLGEFFMDSIDIDLRPFSNRASAETTFAVAMNEAFPRFDFSTRKLSTAFVAITDLMAANRGKTLTKDQMLRILGESLEIALIPNQKLRIHVRSDRGSIDNEAIEIDASAFSGNGGIFPVPERWHSDLAMPIDATARWAREHNHQRIEVSGSYRISTAFALGWFFRSAVGFEIDINTRTGPWATDDYPLPDYHLRPLEVTQPTCLLSDRLVVTVGILRDPRLDVQKSLSLSGDVLLSIVYQLALTSGAEAQACIQGIKLAISRTVSQFHPSSIDLFIAGPAALSIGLGHRWNGLPSTQVYEFLAKEGRYIPTFIIG